MHCLASLLGIDCEVRFFRVTSDGRADVRPSDKSCLIKPVVASGNLLLCSLLSRQERAVDLQSAESEGGAVRARGIPAIEAQNLLFNGACHKAFRQNWQACIQSLPWFQAKFAVFLAMACPLLTPKRHYRNKKPSSAALLRLAGPIP